MDRVVRIFDTTLRDGEQSPGCSMNLDEKVMIATELESMGIDVIEAGFAAASQGDYAAIQAVASRVRSSSVAALARATANDIDAAAEALKKAVSPRIHTFVATSKIHMVHKLRMSEQQVLEHTSRAVAYARKLADSVEFSAEDAGRTDPDFLVKVCRTAIKSGATIINIPDTVGYLTPLEVFSLISYLRIHVPEFDSVELSIHCHDDLGLAVANTLAAVEAGATQVECTVNGIGERAGNAALEEVVMALCTRRPYFKVIDRIDTRQIAAVSKLVETITGFRLPPNKAVVGGNAFAHEAGIHQHGMLASKETYEIMSPEQIGRDEHRLVLGKHSGRHAFENHIAALGYHHLNEEQLRLSFSRFKVLADHKKRVSDQEILSIIDSVCRFY
jgi:2-isopropylmalate synthase